ncbi:MAG: hypothetical protein HVK41_04085 [Pelagibacteraceae bacterium]|jgi:sugar/nucleoside kinase (ribokinase family)|nr:hypothetical protein [Pelagibacteraceae bacterium]HJO13626.1 PfkB family carbohydrate kinase [Alphaproteobacteria bacterium]MBO6467110.1 hypothetical protein [Pelagibacteraceae bacterium]MBO6468315.1 hypothetical protein [Pelagibacteraceae bacterium]MBO6470181.1 hypothetical protein [Pelagibacteraceae bacterium]|tara:strand:- start:233 stop:1147 length:915 start_codon:yes stop_codon:yes gene_type:complete
MFDKGNKFICIGAVHTDYILQLKTKHINNRTNPIKQTQCLGGVAYNIAEKLSFLNLKTELISLNCQKNNIEKISKNKITFKALNLEIYDRSYTSVLNTKGEMILGLANMDNYERPLAIKNIINNKNNRIILDLNFSLKSIKSLVSKYSSLNTICVCGTSVYKVYKIKKLLHKINILILNKQESLNLSNKKNIKDALKFIITKNKNLTVVITNGKNYVKAYHNKNIYSCKPLKTNIKNENKAGDVMSAFFYYYFFQKLNFASVLSKSIAAGSLHVSGFISTKINYLKMIDELSEKIKVRIKKSVR